MKHDLAPATMGLLELSLVQRSMPPWYSILNDDDDSDDDDDDDDDRAMDVVNK